METYRGHVKTPADAIKLFEACRLGVLPRVQRRLSEKERQSICSGSVFVWDEREAGMRRWTDGKSWSASRVSGSFLTYREMEGKRGGGGFAPQPRRQTGRTPESGKASDEDVEMEGEGPDGYRYKPDGLMKQSFSITTNAGQHLHLISYFTRQLTPDMLQPTTDPSLRGIIPVKGMYPESTVQEPSHGPIVARAPLQYAPQPHPGSARSPYGYAPPPPGYNWPPSPSGTPGYVYPTGPYPPPQHAVPQYHAPAPHTHPGPSPYDRGPPHPQIAPPPPHIMHQKSAPYASLPSPRIAGGSVPQEQARASEPHFQIDPRISSIATAAIAKSQAASALEAERQQAQERETEARIQAAVAAEREKFEREKRSEGRVTPPGPVVSQLPPPTQSPRRARSPAPTANMSTLPERTQPPMANMGAERPQPQTIPSISSLVHATDSPPRAAMMPASTNGGVSPHGSRSGSVSPSSGTPRTGGSSSAAGPQGIPLEKVHRASQENDRRAIGVLDRKFCI